MQEWATAVENGDVAKAERGEKISQEKCFTCHTPTEEAKVGPGWKGVTERRTAHWIMNLIIDPQPMLEQDYNLRQLVEKHQAVMPDMKLTDAEARDILEYMRKIDGVKPH